MVTRAVGYSSLCIDSICIIQGPGGDFDQQAKQMEQVYSGAYCVITASRLPGHYAGFHKPRIKKDAITLYQERELASFYICQSNQDFGEHIVN